MIGLAVRVHSRTGDDLGLCHVPPPVEVGDVLELGRGPTLLLRVVELVETSPHSPLAGLVKVSPAQEGLHRFLDAFETQSAAR